MIRRRHRYDPDCLACTDPARLAGWLADEREQADALDAQAAAIRQDAVRADAAVLAATGWRALMAAQADQRRLYGTVAAHTQHARSIRAHADRVEAAHPSGEAR